MPNVFPTRKRDWAKAGDTVISLGGMTGVVVRVVPIRTLPVAVVRWTNGHEGRISITNIRVVPNA